MDGAVNYAFVTEGKRLLYRQQSQLNAKKKIPQKKHIDWLYYLYRAKHHIWPYSRTY